MITTLVLARLLLPGDFGLVSIALVIINSLALLRDMGMSQALIYRRADIEIAADTAFFILPAAGLFLAVIAFLAAPALSSFFNVADSQSIIRVLALSLVLSSFGLVPVALLERELSFRRRFLPEIIPVVGYAAAAIAAAAAGFGVWSLVAGELSRSFLLATAIWPFSPWRPHFRFSKAIALELLVYGRHILGAGLAIFLFTTIDNASVAKWLGTEQLGYYVLAFTLGTLPASQIAMSAGRVLFPAYATIQNDHEALAKAYTRTVSCVSAVAAPIALGTLVIGPVFLTTLYGEKWAGSITALQILSFYGLLRAVGGTAGEILKAVGKPRLLARVAYLQLAVVVIPLYPVISRWGINGAALLFTSAMLAGITLAMILACRAIRVPVSGALASALTPVVLSAPAAVLGYFLADRIFGGSGPIALLAGSGALILCYPPLLYIFQRSLLSELGRILRSALALQTR